MQDRQSSSSDTLTSRLWSDYRHWLTGAVVLLLSVLIWKIQGGETVFPESWINSFPFADKVNEFDKWMRPVLQPTTRALGAGVTWFYEYIVDLLIFTQWQIVLVVLVLPAFAYGGLRLGLFAVVVVGSWLVLDMWDAAMETLSLMCISIAFSAIVGIALGIAASQSDRLETITKPILDTMQTLPAYIYLIPAFFLFGLGAPGAILATVIYALPPIVRLTNLGIRQVPIGIGEAATSFGATTIQSLAKVKIPLAVPAIKLGVNQTVMMALALVVLATFIGAPGLGEIVLRGMQRLNVGKALEGGLAIVLMAILLDRVTYAMGREPQRTDQGRIQIFHLFPQSLEKFPLIRYIEFLIDLVWRQIGNAGRAVTQLIVLLPCALLKAYDADLGIKMHKLFLRHAFLIASLALISMMLLLDAYLDVFGNFPKAWEHRFRTPVNQYMDVLVTNETFYAITTGIKKGLYFGLINPLNTFLKGLPWWYTCLLFVGVAYLVSGRVLALITFIGLLFIGATDLWAFSMITLSTVTVSVLICFVVGVPLGIMAAYSRTIDRILKPILDTMQTMPVFVYLVPVIMLFGGGQIPAVIATVIYAIPPLIRCTTLGIRELPEEIDEVSHSFGASVTQTLMKVKIPMAIPAIMIGVNQGIMMALAMEVITPLIGGKGLGLEVFIGMSTASIGVSLQAGIGIVLLAIILDRISQAWTKTQREAMGLS